jgi:hypothetical protein
LGGRWWEKREEREVGEGEGKREGKKEPGRVGSGGGIKRERG